MYVHFYIVYIYIFIIQAYITKCDLYFVAAVYNPYRPSRWVPRAFWNPEKRGGIGSLGGQWLQEEKNLYF